MQIPCLKTPFLITFFSWSLKSHLYFLPNFCLSSVCFWQVCPLLQLNVCGKMSCQLYRKMVQRLSRNDGSGSMAWNENKIFPLILWILYYSINQSIWGLKVDSKNWNSTNFVVFTSTVIMVFKFINLWPEFNGQGVIIFVCLVNYNKRK